MYVAYKQKIVSIKCEGTGERVECASVLCWCPQIYFPSIDLKPICVQVGTCLAVTFSAIFSHHFHPTIYHGLEDCVLTAINCEKPN